MGFENKEALKELDAILSEAEMGLEDRRRTMEESDIPEILTWGLKNRVWTWKSPAQRSIQICICLAIGMLVVDFIIILCSGALAYWIFLLPPGLIALCLVAKPWIHAKEQEKLAVLKDEYFVWLQESHDKIERQIVIEKKADYKRRDYLAMLIGALEIEMGKLQEQEDEEIYGW